MGLRGTTKREKSQLKQCKCCPVASFLPAPRSRSARSQISSPPPSAPPATLPAVPQKLPAVPSKLPAVPPKIVPSKSLPSPSSAASPSSGIINLDNLKQEIENNCACKICVLKTYEKIHTDFLTYANKKQKENIQECIDTRGTRNKNYIKVIELLTSGKFDLDNYWVSYVSSRSRNGLTNIGAESIAKFQVSYEHAGLATFIRCTCDNKPEPHLCNMLPAMINERTQEKHLHNKNASNYSVNLATVFESHQLGASYVCMGGFF